MLPISACLLVEREDTGGAEQRSTAGTVPSASRRSSVRPGRSPCVSAPSHAGRGGTSYRGGAEESREAERGRGGVLVDGGGGAVCKVLGDLFSVGERGRSAASVAVPE